LRESAPSTAAETELVKKNCMCYASCRSQAAQIRYYSPRGVRIQPGGNACRNGPNF